MPVPKQYPLGWRVTIKKGGKKIRRRFSASRLGGDEQAYAAASQFIRKTLSGREIKEDDNSLRARVSQYHNWSERVRQKHPAQIRRQVQCLKVFAEYCAQDKIDRLEQIDFRLCLDFQQYFYDKAPFNGRIRNSNYDPRANWHHYHQFLNSFLNWCLERNYIETNPAKHKELKPKYEKGLPNPFSVDELNLLFKYLDQDDNRVAAYFRTVLYTGMRPGEASVLKWEQVNLRSNVIQVIKTKTKKPRSIPIHPELKSLLKALPTRKNVYVFDNGQDKPVGDNSYYYNKLKRACAIMEIRPHKVYDLRHTFATRLVELGTHLATVSELLGHSGIEQTMVYIHWAPKHLKSAIDKLVF